MPIGMETVVMAAVTVVASAGAFFEVGRRFGRSSAEQDETETDVEELDSKIDQKFGQLQQQLAKSQYARREREQVMMDWLSEIHSALSDKGADIEKPDAVTKGVDIDVPEPDDVEYLGDD